MFEDITIENVTLAYRDSSGSFDNLPKPGTYIESEKLGRLQIREAIPMGKYTDGGASPFIVHLKCSCWPETKDTIQELEKP